MIIKSDNLRDIKKSIGLHYMQAADIMEDKGILDEILQYIWTTIGNLLSLEN